MKTIKSKIMLSTSLIMVVSLCIVCTFTIFMNYRSAYSSMAGNLTVTASIIAENISYQLDNCHQLIEEMGYVAALSDPSVSLEEKQAIFDSRIANHSYLDRGNVIDVNGNSIFSGINYSDREYFQESLKGNTFVTDPMIGRSTGTLSIIFSAPLWENGVGGSKVVGVVYFVPKEEFLNDIVRVISVSKNSYAKILSKEGTLLAYKDMAPILEEYNTITAAQSDNSLKSLASIEQEQIKGKNGISSYTEKSKKHVLAYAPIPHTLGWTLGIHALESDFTSEIVVSIIVSVILLLVTLVIGIFIASIVAGRISLPIRQCAQRLSLMAEGDLTSPVPVSTTKDETDELLKDLELSIKNFQVILGDISFHLGEISRGNLGGTIDNDYPGEFRSIKTALTNIINSLSELIGNISVSANQVGESAVSISNMASVLAENTISSSNAPLDAAGGDDNFSDETIQAMAEKGNVHMSNMMNAVKEISQSGHNIEKVIEVINGISRQINILALNASVEAARAGEKGQGFSVVAEEVRNLANKSAVAARDTSSLISTTINKTEEGHQISKNTAKSLESIVSGVKNIAVTIAEISAASEKMREESITLHNMVGKFKM